MKVRRQVAVELAPHVIAIWNKGEERIDIIEGRMAFGQAVNRAKAYPGSIVIRGDATVVVRPERCDIIEDPDTAYNEKHEEVLRHLRDSKIVSLKIGYHAPQHDSEINLVSYECRWEDGREDDAYDDYAAVTRSLDYIDLGYDAIVQLLAQYVSTDEDTEEDGDIAWDTVVGTAILHARPKEVQEDDLLLTGSLDRSLHLIVHLEVDGDAHADDLVNDDEPVQIQTQTQGKS